MTMIKTDVAADTGTKDGRYDQPTVFTTLTVQDIKQSNKKSSRIIALTSNH